MQSMANSTNTSQTAFTERFLPTTSWGNHFLFVAKFLAFSSRAKVVRSTRGSPTSDHVLRQPNICGTPGVFARSTI